MESAPSRLKQRIVATENSEPQRFAADFLIAHHEDHEGQEGVEMIKAPRLVFSVSFVVTISSHSTRESRFFHSLRSFAASFIARQTFSGVSGSDFTRAPVHQ